MKLTHMNKDGRAKMVDVTNKLETKRYAKATGIIKMSKECINLIKEDKIAKGNVLGTAQIAGIMALKQTPSLIPMCHSLNVEGCDIDFEIEEDYIRCIAYANLTGKTGIEMEVMVGVSMALLCIYDMCKAVDKSMEITDIMLLEKKGGKSGHFIKGGLNHG